MVLLLLNLGLGVLGDKPGGFYTGQCPAGQAGWLCLLPDSDVCPLAANLLQRLPCLDLGGTPLGLRQSLEKLFNKVNILSENLLHVLSYLAAFFFLGGIQINKAFSMGP